MAPWHRVMAASVLFLACGGDVADDGDVVIQLPGGKSDDSCAWTREVVDEQVGRSRGTHSTLRVDRGGFAHVVYEDRDVNSGQDAKILYATNRSGEWVTEVVSTACRLMAGELDYQPLGSQANSNLDLDAEGHAYIACSNGASVTMLDNATGAWRETAVRSPQRAYDECRSTTSQPGEWGDAECRAQTPAYGRHVAIKLDSQGTPYVLYSARVEERSSASQEWLELATKDGDTWRTEIVASVSRYFDLVIDARDRVHIVSQQSGDLVSGQTFSYLTNASGSWQGTNLQSAYRGSMGYFASAAISRSGRLHAVHFNNTFYEDNQYVSALAYVRKGNGQPLVGALKMATTPRAWAADIALDADENLHVAYHDNGTLVYQAVHGDQIIAPMIVDRGGVGSHASLALGGGTINITYFDEGEARLKYARWTCSEQ